MTRCCKGREAVNTSWTYKLELITRPITPNWTSCQLTLSFCQNRNYVRIGTELPAEQSLKQESAVRLLYRIKMKTHSSMILGGICSGADIVYKEKMRVVDCWSELGVSRKGVLYVWEHDDTHEVPPLFCHSQNCNIIYNFPQSPIAVPQTPVCASLRQSPGFIESKIHHHHNLCSATSRRIRQIVAITSC